jgi:hypothetical protein
LFSVLPVKFLSRVKFNLLAENLITCWSIFSKILSQKD